MLEYLVALAIVVALVECVRRVSLHRRRTTDRAAATSRAGDGDLPGADVPDRDALFVPGLGLPATHPVLGWVCLSLAALLGLVAAVVVIAFVAESRAAAPVPAAVASVVPDTKWSHSHCTYDLDLPVGVPSVPRTPQDCDATTSVGDIVSVLVTSDGVVYSDLGSLLMPGMALVSATVVLGLPLLAVGMFWIGRPLGLPARRARPLAAAAHGTG